MSRLGLGCVRLGSVAAGLSLSESIRLIRRAVDEGITWFDTADAYAGGTSEYVLGRALEGRRHSVTLATKGGYRFAAHRPIASFARLRLAKSVPGRWRTPPAPPVGPARASDAYAHQDFDPAYLTSALDASLRRLRTDHIDVYQLHGFGGADPSTVAPGVLDAIGDWSAGAIAAGKFAQLGVAAETLAQAKLATTRPTGRSAAVTAVQIPFGVFDPECGDSFIGEVHRAGLTTIARGLFGAGLLRDAGPPDHPKAPLVADLQHIASASGVSVFSIAMWFASHRPDVDVVLVGATSPRHVDDLVAWHRTAPPGDDVAAVVDQAVHRHRMDPRRMTPNP